MKLLKQTNRDFIVAASIVSVIAGVSLYFLITGIIREETVDTLAVNCLRIEKKIENNDAVHTQLPILEVAYLPQLPNVAYVITDTVIFDEIEGEPTQFTSFTLYKLINGNNIAITCRSKTIENVDVFWAVLKSFGVFLILIFGILFFMNKRSHKKIWTSFYKNLETVKSYSLKTGSELNLMHTSIDEFNELNNVLNNLTNQISRDYATLKNFTENASHELQTPLSIIRNNTELLMQANIDENVVKYVEKIYVTTNRISHVVEALLLLSKIENNQFKTVSLINFNEVITAQVKMYAEIFGDAFAIELKLNDVFKHEMNLQLAGVLVKNLIENGLKHKPINGKLNIWIDATKIVFANPGVKPVGEISNYFNRFTKEDEASKSSGLGLAIVSDICKVSGLQVSGVYEDGNYQFTISQA